jgi:rod shape-determining protein MreD
LINALFLIFAMATDAVLRTWLGYDSSSVHLSFIPQVLFMAWMLMSIKFSLKTALIWTFLLGLTLDFTAQAYILIQAVAFISTVVITRYWARNVNDAYVELTSVLILSIFIKEFSLWGLMRLSGLSAMSWLTWFSHHQFLTLIGNIPLALGIIFLNFMRLRYLARRDFAKQKAERLFWMKLESR